MLDEKISALIDIYGGLLTKKQFDAMDLYYNEDYSLNEIAELSRVSRQGIWENIKQATENLQKYEAELKVLEKSRKNAEIKVKIKELCQDDAVIKLVDSIS